MSDTGGATGWEGSRDSIPGGATLTGGPIPGGGPNLDRGCMGPGPTAGLNLAEGCIGEDPILGRNLERPGVALEIIEP